MNTEGANPSLPPLWALWRNPIVVRCWRSRMRPRAFLAWAVGWLVLAGFLYFAVYNVLSDRADVGAVLAARGAFMPVFVIQCILLLLTGTGAVISGLSQEADEGMIEFQRLTPLPPAWKITGYLFGLPVREYVLTALTLPFSLASIIIGKIPLAAVGKVYLVLLTSTVLYHLTGYVAGFTFRNRRLGTKMVQLLVVVLYMLLPQLSKFGYVVFEHLTIRPVFYEQMMPSLQGAFSRVLPRGEKLDVAFYGLELPQIVFSLTIQGALILVLLSMVRRKWVDASRHTLGKVAGFAVVAGTAVIMLGNLLPLLADGRIFPTSMLDQNSSGGPGILFLKLMVAKSTASEAGILVALLAMLVCVLGGFVLLQIVPTKVEAIRGWRRADRLGLRSVSIRADEATALPWAILCGLTGGATIWIFGNQMAISPWMEGKAFPSDMVLWLALLPVLVFPSAVTIAETCEKKGTFILLMAVWVVPALAMLVLGSSSDAGAVGGFYIGALSPLSSPFCAMTATDARWAQAGVHGHTAFHYGIAFQFCLLLVSLYHWQRSRIELRSGAAKSG